MDPDVQEALDEFRRELRTLAGARTPRERTAAREDVDDAREDLEDVLRRHGYKLSRRDLDELVEGRDKARFRAWFEELEQERAAAARQDDDEDEDGENDDDEDGEKKRKPAAKRKSAAKQPPQVDGTVETEEEWV